MLKKLIAGILFGIGAVIAQDADIVVLQPKAHTVSMDQDIEIRTLKDSYLQEEMATATDTTQAKALYQAWLQDVKAAYSNNK